jgi:hypothetical protein
MLIRCGERTVNIRTRHAGFNFLCHQGCRGEAPRFDRSWWRILLSRIWGFHGGDYEECRRLGYKKPVCTSQETHYVSATEASQLMLCKIWGFHGSDYEEWRLLGYKNQVRTSQESHYVSTTELSQLMQCKIRGFHGGDYEEWRLLGYKNQVRTSQESHYFSGKESSQLMLCKIWSFHSGEYEERSFLGVCRVAILRADVSEELSASIIRVTRIGELGTTLAVTSNRLRLTFLIHRFLSPCWWRP